MFIKKIIKVAKICYIKNMLLIIILFSLVIDFINWLVLKELRTDWLHYPDSRQEQIIFLCFLLVFNFASLRFFRFLFKKTKNVFQIFISTTLVFLSLAALNDIVNDYGEYDLVGEYSIIAITLGYFLWQIYKLWLKKTKKKV